MTQNVREFLADFGLECPQKISVGPPRGPFVRRSGHGCPSSRFVRKLGAGFDFGRLCPENVPKSARATKPKCRPAEEA